MNAPPRLAQLASFRKFCECIPTQWPLFLEKRAQWLSQEERYGHAPEKVAESILADFFTIALNWEIGDLNNQVEFADLVLTKMGLKRLVVEVKRPNSLSWDESSLERALTQARRYAEEQDVSKIAVSDGTLFYAADIENGGLRPRARLCLDRAALALDAYWVSVDGIYRTPEKIEQEQTDELNPNVSFMAAEQTAVVVDGVIDLPFLHRKYRLPAECFAYVEDARKPQTWKLPYRLSNGKVDTSRLSAAIRSVISNYRGARVHIPEKAVPDVLVRLGKAVAEIGQFPGQIANPSETYQRLYEELRRMGRLREILGGID